MPAKSRWRLVLFTTATGRCPVAEYHDGLSGREAVRLMRTIQLFEEAGPELGAPHVRYLGDKLWELRVTGTIQHRVLYFAAPGRRLVLLHAFTKKTPRTPRAEVAVAKMRMADYLERAEE
jgi:phage-related protein